MAIHLSPSNGHLETCKIVNNPLQCTTIPCGPVNPQICSYTNWRVKSQLISSGWYLDLLSYILYGGTTPCIFLTEQNRVLFSSFIVSSRDISCMIDGLRL